MREGAGPWAIAAGLIAVAVVFWIGNGASDARGPTGVTTEIAGLVVFMVGATVMLGMGGLAVVVTGLTSVLLHWKRPLHRWVDRTGAEDFQAITRLVVIGLVILPVLPNEAYGPYDVVNPFKIWLMVVLIVGISLAAYAVQKLLGARTGTLLAGVLGGLISSTATTVSYSRLSKSGIADPTAAAIVIMAASTVVFARVMFEVAVVAPAVLGAVAPPLGAMMGFMLVVTVGAFWTSRSRIDAPEQSEAPSDLTAAVIFGLLYAGVLLLVAAVKDSFGQTALYAVAGISGLTDMDAITLSTAQLMNSGSIETPTGWRLILVGAIANLVFKAGAIAVLGAPELLKRILVLFGISAAGGVALLLLWPG
jgi:uncharacterized membrane protein (DUF4010 family)